MVIFVDSRARPRLIFLRLISGQDVGYDGEARAHKSLRYQ